MTALAYFVLSHDRARAGAADFARQAPAGTVVMFKPATRSLEQNAKMWPMLQDLAEQVQWPVDGKLQLVTKEDWKEIITAGLKKTQRVAQGIEGGFVMLGSRTSQMTIGQMREVIDFAEWFGAERGVVWSEPKDAAA